MKKPPIWATLLTIAGLVVLCSLGKWQLDRLAWKEALLSDVATATTQDPMAHELSAAEDNFTAGFAEGIYLHDKAILIGPRTHEGENGFHVITPFETLESRTILVNRGWIPQETAASGQYGKPGAPGIITGITRNVETPGRFMPDNVPEKNLWYKIDIEQIAATHDLLSTVPYILYLNTDDNRAPLPMKVQPGSQFNNNHLSYAIFWFTMAGVLLVIYFLRFIRKQET